MSLPKCARYVPAPPSQENLDYADLPTIDLGRAQTLEGRLELYPQLRDAFRTYGFIYGVNHGYTQAQTNRVFDIADVPFTAVHSDEIKKYAADIDGVGNYQGYKSRNYWKVDTESGALDQVELYTLNMNVKLRAQPVELQPFLPEIDAFARHNHFNVLYPILRLLALSLELPEETLVEKHTFAASAQTAVSYMKYHIPSQEDEDMSKGVRLKGHTDIGSISILWSQPVGGLQIMTPDGKWKWVRHVDNAVVINTGDVMDFLSGGFYKPTIHRVVQPPVDQRQFLRLCVFYFCMLNDDVRLLPLAESPVLQQAGIVRRCPDEMAPTMEVWRKKRTISYGRVDLKKGNEDGVEEEDVDGIVVRHYT